MRKEFFADAVHPSLGNGKNLWHPLVAAYCTIAVIKLVLLIVIGPIFGDDTPGYVEPARAMLASATWIRDAGLSTGPKPLFTFRMIGYPAVLATAMMVGGAAWPYLVIALQYVLSFAAGAALYDLALELGLSWQLSIVAVAAALLSFPLPLDQSIMTDSLNASFLVLAVCLLTRGAPSGRRLTFPGAGVAGLFLAVAFLTREAEQFLIAALVPLLAARIWLAGRDCLIGSVLAVVVAVAPLFLIVEGYKQWNFYRTGERFVTTSASHTIVDAIAKAAKIDRTVIAGNAPFDRTARSVLQNSTYEEVLTLNKALFAQGYKATDVSGMAYQEYFELWRTHPRTMLAVLRMHISERTTKLTIRPIEAICETIEWGTGVRRCYDYRDLYRAIPSHFKGMRWTALPTFVFQTIESTAAIFLFGGFLLGIPYLFVVHLVKERRLPVGSILTLTAFSLMYITWFVAYGIVHMEDRYLMPVLPFSILGGIYFWREFLVRWRTERQHSR